MLWVVVAALILIAPGAELVGQRAIDIAIARPPIDEPLFGDVEVEVRIASAAAVVLVELWVDGSRVAGLAEPPWVFPVDVGQENREHRFEVVARGADGSEGRAAWVSPVIVIDEAVELDLQQLYVTVTDERGRRVLDLPASVFEVRDDGIRQDLVTFAGGEIPFVATLLVDSSGSMRGKALEVALRGVRAFAGGMAEDDRVKVVLHDDQVRVETEFHDHEAPIAMALEGVEAGNGTAILDQVYSALLELEGRQGRRVVVLLSDGWDLHSVIRPDDLDQLARLSQALLYWVRLAPARPLSLGAGLRMLQRSVPLSAWRDAQGFRRLERQLERLVRRSGGRVYELESIDEVSSAFADVLRELREQYALGYYPDPRRNDGSWRPLRVSLSRPGLHLRVREGYVDR